jgi:YD repeat-containing protein
LTGNNFVENHLNIGTVAQTPSDTIPAGQVISQNPAAGTSVAQGQTVNLVVSSGTVMASVPNLVGLTQANAQVALLASNLSLGTVTKQYSITVPAGLVISQTPFSGSSASPGSAVNLVVSLGVASISVPDVVGKTRSDAETALTAASLVVGNVTERDNRVSLAFNALPSAQGWQYFAYGNSQPETGVFSISNGMLHQNTIGAGFAASSGNRYDLYDVIRPDQPFALNLTARVTRQEGDTTDAFGFIFGVMTGSEQFVFGIGSNGVQDSYGNFIVANIDTRQFHQFRLVATPHAGYQLFIDHRLVASGSGLPLPSPDNTAYLLLGDASGASNAEADVSAFSFRQGAGLVLEQNPAAAVMVGPNAPIDLVLAQKPASVAVPNAVNLPQANAEASLITASFNIGTVNTAISDTVPSGQVISQTPVAGTTVEQESAVNLTVSTGVLKVSVPNVVGLTAAAASAALASAQLTKGTVSQSNNDTVPAGQVLSQNPVSGVSIAKGSAVSLVVSSGPVGVSVPNVAGMTEAAALAALQSANLSLGNKTQSYSDSVAAGHVISQDPPAAASVAKGSAVALVVSLGALPAPISGIHVEPGTGLLVTGDTLSFNAQGILADGSAIPLSGLVWTSSDLGVASIDANGIITAITAGTVTVSAKLGSIIGTATLTVKAATPGDVAYPTAQITAPTDNANLTEPVAVTGTATDANFLKYVLEIAPVGTSNFTTLNTGNAPVANGVLGSLDTTLLQNDLYTLRLTVYDRANNRQESSVQVQVSRELKVGNFTVAFQDVSVPMACMPLTVTRVYDSRDKQKGDFGVGWRLEVNTLKLRESNEMGSGWHVDYVIKSGPFGFPIPTYVLSPDEVHKVSLALPDGHVEEFDLTTTPAESQFYEFSELTTQYTPRVGTLGSLAAVAPTTWLLTAPEGPVNFIDADAELFNPRQYQYTTPDGSIYTIDKYDGVKSVQCANGQSLSFDRNGVAHSDGNGAAFTRDDQGRITAITDPAGNRHQYTYDGNGNLVSYTDPENHVTTFTYDYRHGLLDILDPRGVKAVRNEYDSSGRLTANTDATGAKITYHHDLVARSETVTDRLGHGTVYEYDSKGNVLKQTDALGNATFFTYNAVGDQLTKTDPLGRMTAQEYDNRRNVLQDIDALGNVTKYTYHGLGGVKTIKDPLGHATANDYDSRGNLLSTADAMGGTTVYGYDKGGIIYPGNGLMTSKSDAQGNTTRYNYDATGRMIAETDPQGHVTAYEYDTNGNRTQETRSRTLPDGKTENLVTTFEYDKLNHLVKTTQPDGSISQTVYNAIGKQEKSIDAKGRVTQYEYDDLGRLTKTTYPDGNVESSTYDAEGHRTASTDRAGRTTQYDYDALGRLTQTTYSDGTFTSTTYDAAGQVTASTDTLGHTTVYTSPFKVMSEAPKIG